MERRSLGVEANAERAAADKPGGYLGSLLADGDRVWAASGTCHKPTALADLAARLRDGDEVIEDPLEERELL